MANESLNVDQLYNRYTFIKESDEQKLRNGKTLKFEATAGTSGDGWTYINLILWSQVEHIIGNDDDQLDLSYTNDNGELVVDYEDLKEHSSTCTASEVVLNEVPETYMGEPVVVHVKLSDDGEWLNVMKMKTVEPEVGDSNFDPRKSVESKRATMSGQ